MDTININPPPHEDDGLEFQGPDASVVRSITDPSKLPGSEGSYLGAQRIGDAVIQWLADKFGVAFFQVYTKGVGGGYTLYSGASPECTFLLKDNEYMVSQIRPAGF